MAKDASASPNEIKDTAKPRKARAERARAVVATAFDTADISALKAAFIARLVALAVLAIWLLALMGLPAALFYYGLFVIYIILGYLQYATARERQMTSLYILILFDFLLLAFSLIADNPLSDVQFSAASKLEQGRMMYFFIPLAGIAACYAPVRVIWAGFCAIAAWTLAFIWLVQDPSAAPLLTGEPVHTKGLFAPSDEAPGRQAYHRLVEAIIVIGVVTGILAMIARRARKIVLAQIGATRERANLARYFPPTLVNELAGHETALDAVTAQNAAVLFADVVGFSKMAELEPPERVIGFLRELHSRLEHAIFENAGTLDKYLGDGVMATFGTPRPAPDDACRAIACALAIHAAETAWNVKRERAGYPPVRLSVGVSYGPVVSGDIGSERRMEFATIGDAVNRASRLEEATRAVNAAIIIGPGTVSQARAEDPERAEALLQDFKLFEAHPLPGRSPTNIYALIRP